MRRLAGLKDRILGKMRGLRRRIVDSLWLFAAVLAAALLSGCQTAAAPGRGANEIGVGDIRIGLSRCTNVTVTVTFGDGIVASADGGGDMLDQGVTSDAGLETYSRGAGKIETGE